MFIVLIFVLLGSSICSEEYVIGFQEYWSQNELLGILVSTCPSWNATFGESWKLVDRRYPGMEDLPTDFIIVEIRDDVVNHLLSEASALIPDVLKWIEPNQIHTSSILDSRKLIPIHEELQNITMRKLLTEELLENQGSGVRVAVFDTGIRQNGNSFRKTPFFLDLTGESAKSNDRIGHGTFVAGVIAGEAKGCGGYAPDAELFIFKVFNSRRESLTAWFLDGFNYAIQKNIDVINLSNGGPDWKDIPFVMKIREAVAAGIVVVSAIGNDGPGFGTNYNPADMIEVIGVGGLTADGMDVAPFSSRGMTLWELPYGYGRVKPDILAKATNVFSNGLDGRCSVLSGTSVSSPAVSGVSALIVEELKSHGKVVNAAAVKQIIQGSANRITKTSMFEQGSGRLDLKRALGLVRDFKPHLSVFPPSLDLISDKYYTWPLSSQPLYYSQMPFIANFSVFCSACEAARVVKVAVADEKQFEGIQLNFDHPKFLRAYSGYLGVVVTVKKQFKEEHAVTGQLKMTVACEGMEHSATINVKFDVIPTPTRQLRILWDQFHNINFPPGYFPSDSSKGDKVSFDLNGDHIHTNFLGLFTHLLSSGFFVEVLGSPYTCFDARNYNALLLVDPEDEFFQEEIDKIEEDVLVRGLNLIVVADWYSESLSKTLIKYDEAVKKRWSPATCGANLPALNALMSRFGVSFGEGYYCGNIFEEKNVKIEYDAGARISSLPRGGVLVSAELIDKSKRKSKPELVGIAGFLDMKSRQKAFKETEKSRETETNSQESDLLQDYGRIVVFGDSTVFESNSKPSLQFFNTFLQFILDGSIVRFRGMQYTRLEADLISDMAEHPRRLRDSQNNFFKYSKFFSDDLHCVGDSAPFSLTIPNTTSFPFDIIYTSSEERVWEYRFFALNSYVISVLVMIWVLAVFYKKGFRPRHFFGAVHRILLS